MASTENKTWYPHTNAGKAAAIQISKLDKMKNSGSGKAALARLRRGLGKTPEENPEIWGYVLESLPESRFNSKTTIDEEAVFAALTLYALAVRDSQDGCSLEKRRGISLGKAAGRAVKHDDSNRDSIESRLKGIFASRNIHQMSIRLRALCPLLEKDGFGPDYSRLADDLVYIMIPSQRKNVLIQWARDFVYEAESAKNPADSEEKKEG